MQALRKKSAAFRPDLTIAQLRKAYKKGALDFKVRPRHGFTEKSWALSFVDKTIKKSKRKNSDD